MMMVIICGSGSCKTRVYSHFLLFGYGRNFDGTRRELKHHSFFLFWFITNIHRAGSSCGPLSDVLLMYFCLYTRNFKTGATFHVLHTQEAQNFLNSRSSKTADDVKYGLRGVASTACGEKVGKWSVQFDPLTDACSLGPFMKTSLYSRCK